jgi:imidazolonepropionase-like amidohydrolase
MGEIEMGSEEKSWKALKGKRLIDGKGGEVPKDACVLLEGPRIQAVGRAKEMRLPKDTEVIDLPDCTLMPGLMDIHLHTSAYNILTFQNPRVAHFETTPQLQMLYTLLHAQMCFEMGFTTLRNHPWVTAYGGPNTAELVAIRDAIQSGAFAGPRLLVGGHAIITNSHLDLLHPGMALRQAGLTADGPWELRKLVRSQLRMGCDYIKTCASGGGGTEKEEPDIRNMTQEELDAVVDEAHAFHKRCACHCFTPAAQRMAVRAGVDTIEHCVFTDDEAIAMMKAEDKIIVPTLAHRSDRAIEVRRRAGSSEFVLNKMKKIQPFTEEAFKKFHQAGIKIALGTDTQIDPEMGTSAQELEIYVDYGMTPMEAIQTGTRNAAEALGLERETGTLEAGKWADIIAVAGNPLKDIRILQDKRKIQMVMKEGRIFVFRKPGQEKYVIHDQKWGWKRI